MKSAPGRAHNTPAAMAAVAGAACQFFLQVVEFPRAVQTSLAMWWQFFDAIARAQSEVLPT